MSNEKTELVAVYGSLRMGLGNHGLLSTSKFLGEMRSQPDFTMYSLGAFPAVRDGNSEVTLEIYEITEGVFHSLDRLEGFPSFYNRKVINTDFGLAWIYFLEDEAREYETVVEGGDWTEYYNSTRRAV